MNEELDTALRDALRPVDPGDEFTRAVMSGIEGAKRVGLRASTQPRPVSRVLAWVPAALAASLLIAIVLRHEPVPQPSIEEGLRARQQLIEALRMTSEKLDLAYQVVHDQSAAAGDSDAGA